MGEEGGEEGSGEERQVQKPDISRAKSAHPHHQAGPSLLLPTPPAPFDRWRKGGSQGSKGLLQGHPAREWGRRLHSGLLTPSPVLFRGNTQDLESGALGGSVTHWLHGPAQVAHPSQPLTPTVK